MKKNNYERNTTGSKEFPINIVSIMFFSIGIIMILSGIYNLYFKDNQNRLIKAEAIITDVTFHPFIKGGKKPYLSYNVKIQYEYIVLSKKYTGFDHVETIVNNDLRYQTNKKIVIYYNKKSPEESYIKKDYSIFFYIFIFGLGILLIIISIFIVFANLNMPSYIKLILFNLIILFNLKKKNRIDF